MKPLALLFICGLVFTVSQSVIAQSEALPSELTGYEFLSDSKLKSLKFYVSTAAEVKKAMGNTCENHCDYNADWQISFSYVSSNWSQRTPDGQITRPRSEYVGTLSSIDFRPLRPILLAEGTTFPPGHRCTIGITYQADFHFASRACMYQAAILILYHLANETASDGTEMIQMNQILDISYGPPLKNRDIFEKVSK